MLKRYCYLPIDVCLGLLFAIGTSTLLTASVYAQSIISAPDGTNTQVFSPANNPNQIDISGGTQSGSNLFHSFLQFGLNQGQIANFQSNSTIRNILSRVVGGNPSIIHGIIQVSGGNSNLFLMNPAGIIFGSSAQLNVPAGFIATTANGIGFNNGAWFNAIGNNDYATLVGDPSIFAFGMSQPGAIINAATLEVPSGQTLGLLGGTIVSTGALNAPGGQVMITAVPGGSFVRLSQAGSLLSLEVQPTSLLQNHPHDWTLPIASLPQLLTQPEIGNATKLTLNSAGQPVLSGSGLGIDAGDVVATRIYAGNSGNGGSVQILAHNNINLIQPLEGPVEVYPVSIATNSSLQNGGTISLQAGGNIVVNDRLRASGNLGGGNIQITAGGDVTLNGNHNSVRGGWGNGGHFTVWAGGKITAKNFQADSTQQGNGGTITLKALGDILAGALVTSGWDGNGGKISVTTDTGNITLTETTLSGTWNGLGGDIVLAAPQGSLNVKELISGSVFGQGGNITLTTGSSIHVSSGALYDYFLSQCGAGGAATVSCGSNGIITIIPTGSTTFPGPTLPLGFGLTLNTGQITLNGVKTVAPATDNSLPITNLSILTGAAQGSGGEVRGWAGSTIITNAIVTGAIKGNGNGVDLKSGTRIRTDDINTSSITNGSGGDVTLSAPIVRTGEIDTRSRDRSGSDGQIHINAQDLQVKGLLSSTISINDRVLKLEQERNQEFGNAFGVTSLTPLSVSEIQAKLRQVEQQTHLKPAVIYYQVFSPGTQIPQDLQIIVITANAPPISKTVGIHQVGLKRLTLDFRSQIREPNVQASTYLPTAKQLYDVLVSPIEGELQQRQVTTLLFSIDTSLPSIPFAALNDGQRFLVEKYTFSLIPALSLTETRYVGIQSDMRVLAMGVDQFSDPSQSPLPSVATELSDITNRFWAGTMLLNQEATTTTLKQQSQQPTFQIVHLATHAKFFPDDWHRSYIQLWDQKLHLDQLRQLNWHQSPQKELLVLSACETALGDVKSEMGFAGLAVQAGVKSALASLWSSDDQNTAQLMTMFYQNLRSTQIKAEALQKAQLTMIQREKPLHPYYWAVFTLVGSPW